MTKQLKKIAKGPNNKRGVDWFPEIADKSK